MGIVAASAAERWSQALEAWAIPPEILEAAPESPWGFPTPLFGRAAERALTEPAPGPSRRRALEALPDQGTVLDVGCGGGAASLPLAPPARLLVGVDQSPDLLEVFDRIASRRGVDHRLVLGTWPDVASSVDPADVVVCHHVLYNVPDMVPFLEALTDQARTRVVVEVTDRHPMEALNPLWQAIHGVERPTSPTADDAAEVMGEMGLSVGREEVERPSLWEDFERDDLVAFARRRLCVGPERDAEIDALLPAHWGRRLRRLVTLWWEGRA
jgi:SAM-dependent methyltransferase